MTNARHNADAQSAQLELADTERFLRQLLPQLVGQTAFVDDELATSAQDFVGNAASVTRQALRGLDNVTLANADAEPNPASAATATGRSDVITLRYIPTAWGQDTAADQAVAATSSQRSDGAMINCMGKSIEYRGPLVPQQGAGSRLYLREQDGVKSLMCQATHIEASSSGSNPIEIHHHNFTADEGLKEPLIDHVEAFQILYAVNANADPNTINASDAHYQYMDASAVSAADAWKNVRAIRFGVVLRSAEAVFSPSNTDAGNVEGVHYFCPQGTDFCADGSEYRFKPANPHDGYLRRAFTTTVVLRNNLNIGH